jgi:predicted RNA-binding protein
MCESNAFIRRGTGEELLLKEVAIIEPIEGGYRLRGLFGDEAVVMGKIEEVNLLKHKILFSEEE